MTAADGTPLRVMFDTNAYDAIAAAGDAECIGKLISAGKLVVVTTHVQEDEIRQNPDPQNRRRTLDTFFHLQTERVATSIALWDISIWGESKWGGEDGKTKLTAIQRNKLNASRDEVIGLTAINHSDVFVTDDKSLSKRMRATSPSYTIITYTDFVTKILKK